MPGIFEICRQGRLQALDKRAASYMKNVFRKIYRWLFEKKAPLHFVKHETVSDWPENLNANTVYLQVDTKGPWAAAFICPCGCKEIIFLNLLKTTRPRWQITSLLNEPLSLNPSVWRKKGCRSHFILRSGRVHWCLDDNAGGIN